MSIRIRYLFLAFLFATLVFSTAGAKEPEEKSSKELSGFSEEQLVAGTLSYFSIGTFDSLSDYGGDKDASAILANCWVRAGIEGRRTRSGIEEHGAAADNLAQCFLADTKHSVQFLRDVERIANRAIIRLASVDDEYQGSNLYFRVILIRDGEKNQVEYFANWGHDAEKYGYTYQAPQRLYRWPTPLKKIPCGSSRIISLVTIGADSSVRDDVEFEVVSGNPSIECFNAIEEYLLSSQFIPGRQDNRPIDARQLGLWGRWRRSSFVRNSLTGSGIDAPQFDPKAEGER